MSKVYELYHCKYKGEVVYVGQGSKGRHKHCISGCSHVYKLNEIYFLEGVDKLSVEIIHYSNNKEAVLIAEKAYIKKHQPIFNSVFNKSFSRNDDANEGKRVKSRFYNEEYIRRINKDSDKVKYEKLVEEFYNHFGHSDIVNNEVMLYGYVHYKNIDKNSIALLSRYIRRYGGLVKPKENPYTVFESVLKDTFNVNLKDCLRGSKMYNIK